MTTKRKVVHAVTGHLFSVSGGMLEGLKRVLEWPFHDLGADFSGGPLLSMP